MAVAMLLAATSAAEVARADVFRDIGRGLGLAGFTVAGQHNPLSGGDEILVNRNLVGNTLDFGAWDLTMQGPVSFQVSTGGRRLPQFDIGISTALNTASAAQPLAYVLNYDVGGQETQISGTLLMDADFSLNGFGYYDLSIEYSSRQTVANSGRYANDQTPFDTDLGPINISGNIIADVLALITQPFYGATDTFNPFLSFTGPDSLASVLTGSPQTLQKQLLSGLDVVQQQRDASLAATPTTGRFGEPARPVSAANSFASALAAQPSAVVPEPTVLLLLLLGAPFVARMPMRRRLRSGPRR